MVHSHLKPRSSTVVTFHQHHPFIDSLCPDHRLTAVTERSLAPIGQAGHG
jgi:hypothetical protein